MDFVEALEKWGDAARDLDKAIGPVNEIKSSHLTFDVNSEEDETVIVSIPYEKPWNILCDGKKIQGHAAIGQLMSFEVPAGKHVIDMKYTPEGTYPGLILSAIGIVMFVLRLLSLILTKDEHERG